MSGILLCVSGEKLHMLLCCNRAFIKHATSRRRPDGVISLTRLQANVCCCSVVCRFLGGEFIRRLVFHHRPRVAALPCFTSRLMEWISSNWFLIRYTCFLVFFFVWNWHKENVSLTPQMQMQVNVAETFRNFYLYCKKYVCMAEVKTLMHWKKQNASKCNWNWCISSLWKRKTAADKNIRSVQKWRGFTCPILTNLILAPSFWCTCTIFAWKIE